jgi:hypothetical protein
MAPTQKMKVEVVDCLPAVVTGIDDDAISLVELMLASQVRSSSHQVTEQRLMLRNSLRLGCDVFLRDDEQVCGGLGIDIGKTYAELIFVKTVRRYLSGKNPAKKTVGMQIMYRTSRSHTTFISRNTSDAARKPRGCTMLRKPRGSRLTDD